MRRLIMRPLLAVAYIAAFARALPLIIDTSSHVSRSQPLPDVSLTSSERYAETSLELPYFYTLAKLPQPPRPSRWSRSTQAGHHGGVLGSRHRDQSLDQHRVDGQERVPNPVLPTGDDQSIETEDCRARRRGRSFLRLGLDWGRVGRRWRLPEAEER